MARLQKVILSFFCVFDCFRIVAGKSDFENCFSFFGRKVKMLLSRSGLRQLEEAADDNADR